MKLMNLVVAAMLFSVSAFGDFTGDWSGSGTLSHHRLGESLCEDVQFSFTQSNRLFAVGNSQVFCEGSGLVFADTQYRIKENELYNGRGEKVGAVSPTKVSIKQVGRSTLEQTMQLVSENEIEMTIVLRTNSGRELSRYELVLNR